VKFLNRKLDGMTLILISENKLEFKEFDIHYINIQPFNRLESLLFMGSINPNIKSSL